MLRHALAALVGGVLSRLAVGAGVARLDDALGVVRYGRTMVLPDQLLGDGNRAVSGALAVLAFAVAGLLVAVVIQWVSPRSLWAPAVVGAAYLGLGAWATFAPGSVPGTGLDPAWGYAPVLAGLLLAPVAVRRPFRRPFRGSTGTYLALAAGAWLATGIGVGLLARADDVSARGESLQLGRADAVAGVAALVFLSAAGLAIGVLSRVGHRIGLAAGLAYVVVSVFAMCAPETFTWPSNAVRDALITPAWGYGLLLAVPLLLAARPASQQKPTAITPAGIPRS